MSGFERGHIVVVRLNPDEIRYFDSTPHLYLTPELAKVMIHVLQDQIAKADIAGMRARLEQTIGTRRESA